jgi:hypothetical protein
LDGPYECFSSHGHGALASQLLPAMRHDFGGHLEEGAGKSK